LSACGAGERERGRERGRIEMVESEKRRQEEVSGKKNGEKIF
jgi:hypothetical protein